ncbi:MAG: TorF family putative porin [Gammaproteobacteria bacterium]|tara:strand:+ start:209 stop:940 length:732 start_codon:yes stop_codon:yes gene_type:complete
MVKNYLKKATAGIALLAMSSFASADGHSEISYSANLGFMSDYIYRGVHQSSSSAMGGFDIEYGSFYLGTWFADLQEDGWVAGSHRGFEYDVYAGFGFDLTDSVSGYVGYTIYRYTDKGAAAFDDDYDEVNVGVSFALTDDLSLSLDYSNGENTLTDQSEVDYDILTTTIEYMGAYFTYGDWGVSEDDTGETDAEYIEIGYSRTVGDFDLSGAFVLSEQELAQASDTDEDGDFSRFVMTISTGF